MAKLIADKVSGPDSVTKKLLKFADDSFIPFLLSVFNRSVTCNTVPASWKAANILGLYKKDDELISIIIGLFRF